MDQSDLQRIQEEVKQTFWLPVSCVEVPLSICSPRCPKGHRKLMRGQHACCFNCQACPAGSFLNITGIYLNVCFFKLFFLTNTNYPVQCDETTMKKPTVFFFYHCFLFYFGGNHKLQQQHCYFYIDQQVALNTNTMTSNLPKKWAELFIDEGRKNTQINLIAVTLRRKQYIKWMKRPKNYTHTTNEKYEQ